MLYKGPFNRGKGAVHIETKWLKFKWNECHIITITMSIKKGNLGDFLSFLYKPIQFLIQVQLHPWASAYANLPQYISSIFVWRISFCLLLALVLLQEFLCPLAIALTQMRCCISSSQVVSLFTLSFYIHNECSCDMPVSYLNIKHLLCMGRIASCYILHCTK